MDTSDKTKLTGEYQIWAFIPEKVKKVTSLDIFKLKVKEFYFNDCLCGLYKDYIKWCGFYQGSSSKKELQLFNRVNIPIENLLS